jgi:chromosome segregation ATPase
MEPFSRIFAPSGNTSSRLPAPNQPSIPSSKMPLGPVSAVSPDMKKLKELHDVLQVANTKLMKQIVDLQDQLAMKNKEYVIMLSDADLFAEAQQRPYFDEWFKKMLGTNRELDDLRALEREIAKFRESIQKRLDSWKAEYKIFISLDQEMRQEGAKPTSVTEVLSLLATEIDRDLRTIFSQIEDTFKNLSKDLAERKEELEMVLPKLDAQTELIKQLCQKLDVAKDALNKQEELYKAYQEMTDSERKAREALQVAQHELSELKMESEAADAEIHKLKEELIQKDCESDALKSERMELQHRCKRAEDRVKVLGDAEEERKYLFDCLDKSQKALAEARSQVRMEALKRSKLIGEVEDVSTSFQESSLIESARLKAERLLRSEIAIENESLRMRCASLEEQLRKEVDADEVCKRNGFMIRFIQSLDIETQLRFKEQFQKEFGV